MSTSGLLEETLRGSLKKRGPKVGPLKLLIYLVFGGVFKFVRPLQDAVHVVDMFVAGCYQNLRGVFRSDAASAMQLFD